MSKVKVLSSIGLLTGVALTLTACGSNSNSSSNSASSVSKFKDTVPTKTAKSGGTVNYAIETDSPFTGIFSNELSTTSTDSEVMQFGNESLLATDDSYKFTNKGAATFKLDKNAKTITIEVKKGVKWSDGKQVTAKDIEYAYEIIANKDTNSQRYTSSLADIV
ncbi:ABC transporter substrate-binding protein, partial [Lactobacillus mulieris]